MTKPPNAVALVCARCDVADLTVIRRENGIPNHPKPMDCIAALKQAIATLEKFAFLPPRLR